MQSEGGGVVVGTAGRQDWEHGLVYRVKGRTEHGTKVLPFKKDEIRVLNMPAFIDAKNLQPFINEDLGGVLNLARTARTLRNFRDS